MSSHFHFRCCLLGVACALGLVGTRLAVAQQGDLDTVEVRTALKAALDELKASRTELATEQAAGRSMAVKLGAVTAESASLREELGQLKLRAEALGAGTDPRGLEKKLLDALNDLRVLRSERNALETRLNTLTEATASYLRASEDEKPQLRHAIETALTAAAAGPSVPSVQSVVRIESSQVVSVKPEQRLIVVNAGQKSGMKLGTPLRIYRNDRPTASAVVVDVRPTIAGGLITEVEGGEFPKVGDTLRIDVRPQH